MVTSQQQQFCKKPNCEKTPMFRKQAYLLYQEFTFTSLQFSYKSKPSRLIANNTDRDSLLLTFNINLKSIGVLRLMPNRSLNAKSHCAFSEIGQTIRIKQVKEFLYSLQQCILTCCKKTTLPLLPDLNVLLEYSYIYNANCQILRNTHWHKTDHHGQWIVRYLQKS